ncbi:MAG TPA: FtsX-like permease family protein [Vicinamibacterales bacterium]|nr:FtsX-like permease family protein [Vicinamibacterales bacterium]
MVAERTKEIGIRTALGARLARITGSVVANRLALVAVGVAGSLLLLRSLGTLLFGVTPYDVPTYAIVVVLLGAIAAFCPGCPRAARIEPLTALRQEQDPAPPRHTFCSHLAMRGAPALATQELAGHQDSGSGEVRCAGIAAREVHARILRTRDATAETDVHLRSWN